jgi:integrase
MNDLITQWRVLVKLNLKRSTQDSYEWAFKRIQQTFGPAAVADIERAEVQAFLTASSRELAPESVRDLRARLRGVITLAEEWGWLKTGSNPAAGRMRLPGRAPRVKRIPTPDEFRTLVQGLPQPYRAIVCLAGLGGLRRGELAALRWDDFQGRKVVVDEAVYRGSLDTPKSLASKRTVTIPSIAVDLVEDWRSQCRFQGQRDFAFSIRTNSPIDLNRVIERTIKPIAEGLGLPRFSWHDFRHAYTTWGRSAGVEVEIMRDQVGHASVLMTQDVYSHLDDREGAADKIGRYVWSDDSEEAA